MNVKKIINKALIAIDAIFHGWKFKPNKNSDGKKIVIVFQQLLGDAIVITDSLSEYTKIFPKNQGFQVKFLARPSVIAFMKSVCIIPDDLVLEELDFKKLIENFAYYKSISKKYRNNIDVLIVPVTTPSAEIFSCSSNAPRKIASVRPVDIKKSILMSALSKFSYTEKIRPLKSEMTLQRHRQLINYLANNDDFKARLPKLKSQTKIIHENHYCVVCAGASKPERWWQAEKFSEIIDFLNENYKLNVHLCGGDDESKIENSLHVKHPEMLFSHIGKTNFSEWSSIVQYADLVVANDSATAHLAAAHNVKTVCIIGDYEFVMFPYKVDILEKNQRLPECVFKRFPCENCRDIGYYAGSGNPDCKNRINNNQCTLCIDAITVDDVKNSIIKIMKEG